MTTRLRELLARRRRLVARRGELRREAARALVRRRDRRRRLGARRGAAALHCARLLPRLREEPLLRVELLPQLRDLVATPLVRRLRRRHLRRELADLGAQRLALGLHEWTLRALLHCCSWRPGLALGPFDA